MTAEYNDLKGVEKQVDAKSVKQACAMPRQKKRGSLTKDSKSDLSVKISSLSAEPEE